MAKVNVFISSTCYDLSQIRDDLKRCIIELGHNPILSENKDFPIDPNLSNAENCINAINSEADILVLIIGDKYGSVLENGKSITNTEFITALNKGIPIYTFALRRMIDFLPMWEKNPDVDFTSIVDNNKVFEFLSDIRKKSGIWNFEFDKAQDIIDILKLQFSNLFHNLLVLKSQIDTIGKSNLYLKISSKALNILLNKPDGYEIKFFMQTMFDEICKYKDLKNDYEYFILTKPTSNISDKDQILDWTSFKLGYLKNYIITLNKLVEPLKAFLAKSDIDGLYYVAQSYAKIYAYILEWGIEVRSIIASETYSNLLSSFAKLPQDIIKQIEEFPIKSLKVIEERLECIKLENLSNSSDIVSLTLNVSIDDEDMQRYNDEFKNIFNAT